MPFFKFKSKKEKEVPKRASSMNNIYNDYSGVSGEDRGATKKDIENVDKIEKYKAFFQWIIRFKHKVEHFK